MDETPTSKRMDDRNPMNKNYDYGFPNPRDTQDRVAEEVCHPGPDFLHDVVPEYPEHPTDYHQGQSVPDYSEEYNASELYSGTDRDDHPEDAEAQPAGPPQGDKLVYSPGPSASTEDAEPDQFNDPSNFEQGAQEPVSGPSNINPYPQHNVGLKPQGAR